MGADYPHLHISGDSELMRVGCEYVEGAPQIQVSNCTVQESLSTSWVVTGVEITER